MRIPPEREGDVLAKAAQGWTHRKIAAWLAEEGIQTSQPAVTRLLQRLQAQHADSARAVVREKLASAVSPGLDQLAIQTDRVRRLCTRLYNQAKVSPKAVSPFLKAVEQLRKNVDTQLHYSGADQPDDSLTSLADAERRLYERLSRAVGAGEGDAVPGDGGEPDAPGTGGG